MRTREWLAIGVVLIGVAMANAESAPLPQIPQPAAPSETPSSLPPLAEVPRPEHEPTIGTRDLSPAKPGFTDEECGPSGRFWITPSLEFAFTPRDNVPTNVRLRLPVFGGSIPGPVVPVTGRSTGSFNVAFGLIAGLWLTDTQKHGIEASFFYRNSDTTFDAVAPGFLVNYPYGPERSTAQITALPPPWSSMVVGWLPSTLGTEYITTDVNYRFNLLCMQNARLDVLVGYRYGFLRDELFLGKPWVDYDNPNDYDHYRCDCGDSDDYRRNRLAVVNNFHGGQIGLAGEVRMNSLFIASSAKVAFGTTTAKATTSGAFIGAEGQIGSDFQRLRSLVGGSRNEFAVMPSFNLQVGCQATEHVRFFVGYSFTYLSRVARLSDALNPSNSSLNFTDFWVQSIGLGAEIRF